MGLDILIRIQMQITEGEILDMRLKSMEQPLKLFLLHPGDEVFLILESFPYNADIKPAEIEFESHSEYWFSLEIKARKENWKVDPSLSSMLLPTVLFFKANISFNAILLVLSLLQKEVLRNYGEQNLHKTLDSSFLRK